MPTDDASVLHAPGAVNVLNFTSLITWSNLTLALSAYALRGMAQSSASLIGNVGVKVNGGVINYFDGNTVGSNRFF